MSNLETSKKSIIQLLIWFNLIFIIVSIFYVNKSITLMITIINFISIGAFFVINKYSVIFEGLFLTNKLMKGVNNMFEGA